LWQQVLCAAPDIAVLFDKKDPARFTFRKLRDHAFSPLPAAQFRRLEDLLCDKCFNG